MKSKIIVITLLFFFSFKAISQTPGVSPSLFFNNLSHYNSAFIGGGEVNFKLLTRQQWLGMDNYPEIYNIAIDMPVSKLRGVKGLGVSFLQTSAGDGNLKTINISNTSSFRVLIGEVLSGKAWLSMGLRFSYIHNSIDWSNFTFSNQIHPLYGVIYSQPAIISSYPEKINTFKIGTGFLLKHQYTRKKPIITNVIGVNFENLAQTQYSSFIYDNIDIPILLTVNYGTLISYKRGKIKSLASAIVYERQSQINTCLFGTNIAIRPTVKNNNSYVFNFGLWSRVSGKEIENPAFASVILIFGLQNIEISKNMNINIAYSYDIETINKFKPGGTHEINLTFNFPNEEICFSKKQKNRRVKNHKNPKIIGYGF